MPVNILRATPLTVVVGRHDSVRQVGQLRRGCQDLAAIGLLAAAGGGVLAGIWLPLPIRFTRPGPTGRAAMIAAWVASIAALVVCAAIYLRQEIHDVQAAGPGVTAPKAHHPPRHLDGGRGSLRHHHLAQIP